MKRKKSLCSPLLYKYAHVWPIRIHMNADLSKDDKWFHFCVGPHTNENNPLPNMGPVMLMCAMNNGSVIVMELFHNIL